MWGVWNMGERQCCLIERLPALLTYLGLLEVRVAGTALQFTPSTEVLVLSGPNLAVLWKAISLRVVDGIQILKLEIWATARG